MKKKVVQNGGGGNHMLHVDVTHKILALTMYQQ